jgi:hypothetical protein
MTHNDHELLIRHHTLLLQAARRARKLLDGADGIPAIVSFGFLDAVLKEIDRDLPGSGPAGVAPPSPVGSAPDSKP